MKHVSCLATGEAARKCISLLAVCLKLLFSEVHFPTSLVKEAPSVIVILTETDSERSITNRSADQMKWNSHLSSF